MIKVYTTTDCQQCEQTKKYLTTHEVPFEVVDLTTNPEAMTMVKAMGYMAAPVVVTESDHWSGFKYDKLQSVVATHREKHDTIKE